MEDIIQRVTVVEDYVNKLINQFLPPIAKRLRDVEERCKQLEDKLEASLRSTGSKPRKKITYTIYCDVHRRSANGDGYKVIAKDLDLPESTVRLYLSMKQERVIELAKAEGITHDPDKFEQFISTPVTPTTPEGTPYSEQIIETQAQVNTAPDIPDAPVVEPEHKEITGYRVVECPPVEGGAGIAGWKQWPAEYRRWAADGDVVEGGYPTNAPCPHNTLVDVIFENHSSVGSVPAHEVDWGLGGVKAWRPVYV